MNTKTFIKTTAAAVLFLFVALNAMAFMHVYKMTHFTSGGPKVTKPEHMTAGQKAVTLFTGVNVPKPETVSMKPSFDYETINFPGYKGTMLEAWHARGRKSDTVVVLFHGYIESKSQLVPEAEKFYAKGYSVLLVDFYGSGGSGGNDTSIGYYEADDVKAAFEKAGELKYKKIIFYAVSMGSAAALRAISLYGLEPECIIIESPFAGLLDTVRRRFDLLKAPSTPFAELLVFWGGIIKGYNGFTYNPWVYAKDVKTAALLLHGAKDRRVSNSQAKLIFDSFGGEKKMVIFPEGGHLSFMKTDGKTWDREVFGFIEGK